MRWNERKQLLVDMLADPTDRRTKKEKSKAAGFNETEVFRLQRDSEFRHAVLARARELVGVNLPAVYASLFRIAMEGKDRDAIQAADKILRAAGEIESGGHALVNIRNEQRGADEETLEEAAKRIINQRELDYLEGVGNDGENKS